MRPTILAVLVLMSFGSPAAAQTQAAIDSITALNRTGRWLAAAQLARNTIGTVESLEDRCAVRVGMIYALARLGMTGPGANELKVFDEQCAGTSVAEQQARDISDVRAIVSLPPLPVTGLDFTAIDEFWRIVDILQRGETPTEAQWRVLLNTPGYRLALDNVPTLRDDIALAYSPARRAQFDSVTKVLSDRAARLRHIARALPLRAALNALRDSLARATPIAEGVRAAARFLPAGATEGRQPPLVAVAIFTNDGYASEDAAVVDLVYILDNGLVALLSHEFHHVYAARLSSVRMPPPDSADFQLMGALSALRTEGIADLIDKPYPLTSPNPEMARYVMRYRETYDRTPAILRTIDSLLVVAGDNPAAVRSAGTRARVLLWSNSHPNGAYMARTIQETLDMDALLRSVANPFDFIRTYAEAERRRGNPPPFSPKAIAVLDALERKYLKPAGASSR